MENKVSKILKEIQPSKREQLKAQKIEQVKLGTIDEIEELRVGFEQSFNEAQGLREVSEEYIEMIDEYRDEIGRIDEYVINGTATDLEEYADDLREKLIEVSQTADELGIDPDSIVNGFTRLLQQVDEASAIYEGARASYTEVVNYSGFLNNFWR
jgi:uncharacterized coiled-coil DUF342 family protein